MSSGWVARARTRPLPDGHEGQAYSIPIELLGDEDEGCAVYAVDSGTFPPGLSVNSDGARIEGTPTQAGSYRFYLDVTLYGSPYPCGRIRVA